MTSCNNQCDQDDLGALMFAQLPPWCQEAVFNFCRSNGSEAFVIAASIHAKHVGGLPLMSFIPPATFEKTAWQIRGARAYIRDALSSVWTVEKFKELYLRQGISDAYAQQLAERTFTPDSNWTDYVGKVLNWLPDLPGTDIDDFAKAKTQQLLNWLTTSLFTSVGAKAQDTLLEMRKVGEIEEELQERLMMITFQQSYSADAPSDVSFKQADGSPDLGKMSQLATAILPVGVSLLGRLVGRLGPVGAAAGTLLTGGKQAPQLTGDVHPDADPLADGSLIEPVASKLRTLLRYATAPGHAGDVMGFTRVVDSLAGDVALEDPEAGDFLSDLAGMAGSFFGGSTGEKIGRGIADAAGNLLGGSSKPKVPPQPAAPAAPNLAPVLKELRAIATRLGQGQRANAQDHQKLRQELGEQKKSMARILAAVSLRPTLRGPMVAEPMQLPPPDESPMF